MPNFALQAVNPDQYCNLTEIAGQITELVAADPPQVVDIPNYIKQEASIAMKIASRIRLEEEIGEQVPIGCPECDGPMWLMEHEKFILRYRCHTGHGSTVEALFQGQSSRIEESLWVVLRTLEERLNLLKKSQSASRRKGYDSMVQSLERKIEETRRSRDIIREAMDIPPPKLNDESHLDLDIHNCH